MSESGTLALEDVPAGDWDRVRRNFEAISRFEVGRGPAQARVYNSANISVANDTLTALTFNSERYDTGGFHSTSSNTSRLTAPTSGLYLVGCCVDFAADADGWRAVQLVVNGTVNGAIIASDLRMTVTTANVPVHVSLSATYHLDAADYVEVMVHHTAGAALNVLTAADFSPEFWIVRLGSQA